MAHFPIFLDLKGALVFFVGEDPRKAEILRGFGAEVQVVSDLTEKNLANSPRLVVLAQGDRAKLSALCRSRNIPVNSVDDPENCTCFFPALIRRGDTTVAISSGGTAPAASKALRRHIEDTLPDNLEQILPWLGDVTAQLRALVPDYAARAELLEQITQKAFALGRPLTQEEVSSL